MAVRSFHVFDKTHVDVTIDIYSRKFDFPGTPPSHVYSIIDRFRCSTVRASTWWIQTTLIRHQSDMYIYLYTVDGIIQATPVGNIQGIYTQYTRIYVVCFLDNIYIYIYIYIYKRDFKQFRVGKHPQKPYGSFANLARDRVSGRRDIFQISKNCRFLWKH